VYFHHPRKIRISSVFRIEIQQDTDKIQAYSPYPWNTSKYGQNTLGYRCLEKLPAVSWE
jgi:hypothetical protein